MSDLECVECGATASYADAQAADRRNTCGGERVVKHTPIGRFYDGEKHDWKET
ncbi:hypothetical protein M196_gp25 [Halorubrum tailed virus 4]|uniref:CxxC motif protein n=1 Tax=Halorubrum tailed virus 4 TaxID=1273752 RepID=R4T622_9CAUD|nr:hypothetical protein M196_gp25 [Halorubrum tailed virus 4]AGM11119.1 hypothetical protein HRTV4_25 [Halorubrum tailed virus 4]